MDLEFFTSTLEGSALFVLGTALITGVLFECANRRLMHIVSRKPWWPNARPLQAALFKNFGYPEEDLSEEALLDGYAFVLVGCGHHLQQVVMVPPQTLQGWPILILRMPHAHKQWLSGSGRLGTFQVGGARLPCRHQPSILRIRR